ncbi:hypothetical protein AF74_00455 [Aliarcobacter butzleri L349]|nr:hypothetical protein AF74_00455 [Aliarcobacter butzleri L349]
MKIKVYLKDDVYKIVTVLVIDDIRKIANKYERWEYVL